MLNTSPRAKLHLLGSLAPLANSVTTFAAKVALLCALAIPTMKTMKKRFAVPQCRAIHNAALALGFVACILGLAFPAKAQGAKIITFDVPGSVCEVHFISCTVVNAINPEGVVVGTYDDANGAIHGYLRAADGTLTKFDVPGSFCTSFNGFLTSCASPTGINPHGEITGSYSDVNGFFHGFLLAPDGTFTTFDAAGSIGTSPTGISPGGVVT